MDIRHYFDAVDFKSFRPEEDSDWKYTLGESIEVNTNRLSGEDNFQKVGLVLVGTPFDSDREDSYDTSIADTIRKEIYLLAKPEDKISVVDLGNIKPAKSIKGNYKAIRDVIDYLREQKLPVLVLGGSQDLSYGIVEAFKSHSLFSFATIDPFLDVKKGVETLSAGNYLSKVFQSNPDLFSFSLLAYQGHLVPSEYFNKAKGLQRNLRLGKIREDIRLAEPILRNTNFLSFDVAAIKHSDAPSQSCLHPNGLRSEEACQLARYAGLSRNLEVFGIFGYDPKKDISSVAIRLFAQIAWYFIEGKASGLCLSGWEDSREIYQVDIRELSKPITFIRNTNTDQWSMELQSKNNKKIEIACSEQDYIEATKNEIPDLWLAYMQKLDDILK